jgi:PKD repeat protein
VGAQSGACGSITTAAISRRTDIVRAAHARQSVHDKSMVLLANSIDSIAAWYCLPPPVVTPPPNQAPVARFTHQCVIRPDNVGADCTFNGSSSTDDQGVVRYDWTASGRAALSGAVVTYPFPRTATPTVALTVSDSAGLTNTVAKVISVDSAATPPPSGNQPPVASFTESCAPVTLTTGTCSVNGGASTDADGTIASYAWSAPGLTSATGPAVTFANVPIGTYAVTLTVTDDKGATAATTHNVVVAGTAPTPPPGASLSTVPTLPQRAVDVSLPAVTRSYAIAAGSNLQIALDTAKRGDEIVLPAGATWRQNVWLRAKAGSCTSYVTVRTSDVGHLPPLGGRIDTATHAPSLARIEGTDVTPVVQTALGACGWRIIGVEVTLAPTLAPFPSTNRQQGIVYLGEPYTSDTLQQGSHMVLDRVWIHARASDNTSRCVLLAGSYQAVIGSQLRECHGSNFDSQAILMYRGTGPYLIENNRLEAAGEVILSGGSPAPNGVVPSDITIRRNFLTRPMTWQGVWTVKNLFELKNAERVLFEENIASNHWCCGQQGPSQMLGTLDNPCGWCIVADVTYRYNQIENVHGGFNLTDRYVSTITGGTPQRMVRVAIYQNWLKGLGASTLGGTTNNKVCFFLQQSVHDLYVAHNTCGGQITHYVMLTSTTAKKDRFTFRSNVQASSATYPIWSDAGTGSLALQVLTAPFAVDSNVFIASSDAQVVTGSGNIRQTAAAPAPLGIGADTTEIKRRLVGVR